MRSSLKFQQSRKRSLIARLVAAPTVRGLVQKFRQRITDCPQIFRLRAAATACDRRERSPVLSHDRPRASCAMTRTHGSPSPCSIVLIVNNNRKSNGGFPGRPKSFRAAPACYDISACLVAAHDAAKEKARCDFPPGRNSSISISRIAMIRENVNNNSLCDGLSIVFAGLCRPSALYSQCGAERAFHSLPRMRGKA
jgi:hypothetical protein